MLNGRKHAGNGLISSPTHSVTSGGLSAVAPPNHGRHPQQSTGSLGSPSATRQQRSQSIRSRTVATARCGTEGASKDPPLDSAPASATDVVGDAVPPWCTSISLVGETPPPTGRTLTVRASTTYLDRAEKPPEVDRTVGSAGQRMERSGPLQTTRKGWPRANSRP